MFERFTDRSRRVLVFAQEEARQLNHSFIGTEHLLLGLIHEREGIAAAALDALGITLGAARDKVEEAIGMTASIALDALRPFTPRAKKVLELSLREALQLGHSYIGTEHILLGLVRQGDGVAAQVLVSLGADLGRVRQSVIEMMAALPSHDSVSGEPQFPESSPRGSWSRLGPGVGSTWVGDDDEPLVLIQLTEIAERLARIERHLGIEWRPPGDTSSS